MFEESLPVVYYKYILIVVTYVQILTGKLWLLSLVCQTAGETDQSDHPQVLTPVHQVITELG